MKHLLFKTLPLFGLVMAATPAWAGSWNSDLHYNGKVTVSADATGRSQNSPWSWDDCATSTSSGNIKPGGSQNGSTSGNFVIVLRYHPSSTTDTPPPFVTLKFRQSINAAGGRRDMTNWPSSYSPAQGSPGRVTLQVQVATPDGKTYSESEHMTKGSTSGYYYRYTAGAQTPWSLVTISTKDATRQNGDYVVRYSLPNVQGSFNVTTGDYKWEDDPGSYFPANDGSWGYAEPAGVEYSSDNREVYLTRGSAPKVKGAPGVTVDEARDEWREVDGSGLWTTHGQSRWSYTNRAPEPGSGLLAPPTYKDDLITISQVVAAQSSGSWSANTSGSWSPSDNRDRQPPSAPTASHVVDLPDGGALLNEAGLDSSLGVGYKTQPGWYKTPSTGKEPTITYKLTDNSSATPVTATAKYVFHLHDEWENPMDDTPSETTQTSTWVVGGWSSHTGADTHTFEWNFTEEHEVALTTTFGADFKLKDWLNIGGKVETSSKFKANVVTGASVTLKGGEKARPYMRYTIRTQHKLVDHYVVAGFDRNQGRADGKWPQSADLALRIPDDIEALWQGPLLTSNPNPGEPT